MNGKSKTRVPLLLGTSCLGAFLAINIIAGVASLDPWGLNAAIAACRERGWQDGTWAMSQSNSSSWLVGKAATIELKPKDARQQKTIHVSLRKPMNLMGWQFVDYTEETTKH